jgi:hypothetical protein
MAICEYIRKKIRERDFYCYHCGATEALEVHHRKGRKMGSSKLLDRLDNLILVCSKYNFEMEADANVAAEAREFGHKLASWEDFSSPVFDAPHLTWYKLSEDGSKVETQPPSYLI